MFAHPLIFNSKDIQRRDSCIQPSPVSKKRFWIGRIISALCILFLLFDAVMKLINVAPVREATARLGYSDSLTLGIVLLVCTVVYVIPRTSILGAILLTGYLGRATATRVRVGEPFYFPIVFGALIWAGLSLRNARLRALIPLQS